MASKAIYYVVAAVGIAAASGAAWWYQNKPQTRAETASSGSPAGSAGRNAGGGAGRPVAVEAATVATMSLVDDTQAVGSLRSRQSVVLRPEVSGRITQLNFRDGEAVRKGQLLVQFDDQLQLAQVQQSVAELSIAQANQKRNQELVAQNFVSQRSLDESAAALQVAQAKVALAQATAARLKLVAPFDGIAGIRVVNLGDYLKDGADIVNIEDMATMYVDFRLPERFLSKVKKGQRADVSLDALPGQKFTALVQAVDPLVDANGRSVSVRGCIDNRALQLRPGMFARVNTVFGRRENARVIPEEAIVPQGNKQFVIKLVAGPDTDSQATQRVEVKIGLRLPGRVEILDGLDMGDRIVTAGQQRLQKDGTVVRVVDMNRAPGGGGAQSAQAGAAVAPGAAASGALAASSGRGQAAAAAQPSAPASAVAPSTSRGGNVKPAVGPNPCGSERRPA